ncbi:hypothetical protein ACMFMG_008550 [Clarireedia jacksonii]
MFSLIKDIFSSSAVPKSSPPALEKGDGEELSPEVEEELKPSLTSETEPRSPFPDPSPQAASDAALTMNESILSSKTKSKKNRKRNRKIGVTAQPPSMEEHVSSPKVDSTKKKKRKKNMTSEGLHPEDEEQLAPPAPSHSEQAFSSVLPVEPLAQEQEHSGGASGLNNSVTIVNEEAHGAERKRRRKRKSKTDNTDNRPDSVAINDNGENKPREREASSPSRSEGGPSTAMNKLHGVTDQLIDIAGSDASSAAFLNATTSAQASSKSHSVQRTDIEQPTPSAKALGKRLSTGSIREHSIEQPSKKRKRSVRSDSRNGDLRSMWSQPTSDDNSHSGSRLSLTSYARDLFASHHDRNRATASDESSPVIEATAISSQAGLIESPAEARQASARSSSKKDPESRQSTKNSSNIDEDANEDPLLPKSTSRRKRRLPVDDSPKLTTVNTPQRKKSKQSGITLPNGQSSPSKQTAKSKIKHVMEEDGDDARRKSLSSSREPKGKLSRKDTPRISAAVEAYRSVNVMTQPAVNEIIQGNALDENGKKFWTFIMDEVPDLPKRNVQSWTRRAFHNFVARGTWTAEEDEELKEAFERNPKKWATIGAELNRLPDDCRDRWRNYLSVTNLARGTWEEAEERQLREAVKKCIELIRKDRKQNGELGHGDEDSYYEKDVDWMKVSELMDSSRSHLQCYRKWKRIKANEKATTDELILERTIMDDSWDRLKFAQDAVKLRAHEKLQFLQVIRDSGYSNEKEIDWKKIDEQLDRSHEVMELRICLRGLKQNIRGHEKMKLQTVIARLITAFKESAPYEPEGYPDLPFESIGPNRRSTKTKSTPRPASAESTSSNSNSKLKNRMLKQNGPQGTLKLVDADEGSIYNASRALGSAKRKKTPQSGRKQRLVSNLSKERVIDSDSEQDIPTSAQKHQEPKVLPPPHAPAHKPENNKKRHGVNISEDSDQIERAESISESEHEASRTLGNSAIDEYAIEDDSEESEAPERGSSLGQPLEENSEDNENETPHAGQLATREVASVDEEMSDTELPEAEGEITSENELQIPATPEYMLQGEEGSVDLDEFRDITGGVSPESSDFDTDMSDIQP